MSLPLRHNQDDVAWLSGQIRSEENSALSEQTEDDSFPSSSPSYDELAPVKTTSPIDEGVSHQAAAQPPQPLPITHGKKVVPPS